VFLVEGQVGVTTNYELYVMWCIALKYNGCPFEAQFKR
jgi:hypothetical protein